MKHAAWLLILAACGDDASGTLELSPRTHAEIQLLLDVAGGQTAERAVAYLDRIPAASTCPRRSEVGDTIEFTGGCTAEIYGAIEGTARSRGDLITFERFQFGGQTYDGTVQLGRERSLVLDLTVEHAELAAHVVLDRPCDEGCTFAGTLVVDGADAAISGRSSFDIDEVRFEIAGAEHLVVERADLPFPCLGWRIVETGRTGTLACPR